MKRVPVKLELVSPEELAACRVAQVLRDHGHEVYLVGGYVRDRLLGRPSHDVDVTTSATPDQVAALFPKTIPVGASFGVMIVVDETTGCQLEVATFRTDGGYQDGRRPESVRFASAEEDAERRDFTINALFYDPVAEEVIDFVGGFEDLRRGIIRAIGDPAQRFGEDHLRMMRAIRFATRFQFELDPETENAIRTLAEKITRISPERIFAEMSKMLTGPKPHLAMTGLDRVKLMSHILPEISCMHEVTQPKQYHPEGDVFVHTMLLLAHMAAPSLTLAWGCLLHDVGKPPTFEIGKHGRETFPCHAKVGAKMTDDILRRLHAPGAMIRDVCALVEHHMTFAHVQDMKVSTLKRLMARDTFPDELELHRIDCMSSFGGVDNWVFLLDKVHELANQPPVPEPFLTGRDLIALGEKPGKHFGRILGEAQDLQLEGELADREAALVWLKTRIGGA